MKRKSNFAKWCRNIKGLMRSPSFFGKSPTSIKKKIGRLKLVVVVRQIHTTTTSNELPSVEEALKLFAVISGLSGTVLGILWGRKHDEG